MSTKENILSEIKLFDNARLLDEMCEVSSQYEDAEDPEDQDMIHEVLKTIKEELLSRMK